MSRRSGGQLYKRRLVLTGLGAAGLAGCSFRRPTPTGGLTTVFAAASMTDALETLAATWRERSGHDVRLSFAGSGSVARQVEAGAPADLVVLADDVWMDRLEQAGRLRTGSRRDLVGNRLALIGPAETEPTYPIEAAAWLGQGDGRIAIGDPQSVPAGAYAREWLIKIGLWDEIRPRLVMASDVRSVRAFVARGEAALGVVYRSDATNVGTVKIVAEPAPSDQPRIRYPAALTADAGPNAAALLQFLVSKDAGAVFRRLGFEPLA